VSTSFTILAVACAVAAIGVTVISAYIPELFHQMPESLVPQVRLGLIIVGFSTALALPFSAFSAIFTGLQRYGFPTLVAVATRVLSAAALILVLLLNGGLVQMAVVMAAFNIASAMAQYVGWRRYVRDRIQFSFLKFHRKAAVRLARYGSVLSLWTLAMLLISGLDTVIVGHFDYQNTGFYSIASNATNVMVALVSSLFGPLLPALSSMQTAATPVRMGEIVIKTTRYCAVLLCLLGLPLLVGAYPLLSMWVGRNYAARSAFYLGVLVIGNVIRQLGFPYVIAVVATGKQHLATLSAIAEATVNIILSIWLVQKFGAIGVAIGTLVGAFVSLGTHLAVSMHYTRDTILIPRLQFVLSGLLRPLTCIAPTVLLYPFWKSLSFMPAPPGLLVAWVILTLGIAWGIVLTSEDKREFDDSVRRLLYWRAGRGIANR
jgi:O-antigen/teichoic acid export membrane protein